MYGKTREGIGLPALCDAEGILLSKPVGGKLQDAALEGRLFMAANQTSTTTGLTLGNAFAGLAIVNPATTGKNYIMHEFAFAMTDSPTPNTNLSLAIGPAHSGFTTDITVRCARWGYATSTALADALATITGASGIIVKQIATLGTNLTTDMMLTGSVVDLGGQFVIPPGYAIYTDTTLVAGAVMMFSFTWEELDV